MTVGCRCGASTQPVAEAPSNADQASELNTIRQEESPAAAEASVVDQQDCQKVEWAKDLPEGAFDEYESRGSVIPEGEHRAIRVPQLHSLAVSVQQLLKIRDLVDDYSKSTISWPTMNL